VIGSFVGASPGPLVIVIAGIHGNEPSGVLAVEQVLAALHAGRPAMHGALVGLAGNLAALAQDTRYVAGDLNRRWRRERVTAARAGLLPLVDAEDREQVELLAALDGWLARPRGGPAVILDLHSFSAEGAPFSVTTDAPESLAMARAFELPAIVALEHHIRGTIIELARDEGLAVVGVEAGTHGDPETVVRHRACIELALVESGALRTRALPGLEAGRAALRAAAAGLPSAVEVVHRHHIGEGAGFRMRPGFRNLHPVAVGEHLADDRLGPIGAPLSGWLLMPLYQGAGEDGFFLARELPVEDPSGRPFTPAGGSAR